MDPDAQRLLETNQRFYDAHEHRDFAAMQAVWEQSDRATCIHPGWPILRGWADVGESWRRILEGPGRNQFIITNVSVVVEGRVGWVTADENLMQGGATSTVAATNVFALDAADEWRMILHHGSPVMT